MLIKKVILATLASFLLYSCGGSTTTFDDKTLTFDPMIKGPITKEVEVSGAIFKGTPEISEYATGTDYKYPLMVEITKNDSNWCAGKYRDEHYRVSDIEVNVEFFDVQGLPLDLKLSFTKITTPAFPIRKGDKGWITLHIEADSKTLEKDVESIKKIEKISVSINDFSLD